LLWFLKVQLGIELAGNNPGKRPRRRPIHLGRSEPVLFGPYFVLPEPRIRPFFSGVLQLKPGGVWTRRNK